MNRNQSACFLNRDLVLKMYADEFPLRVIAKRIGTTGWRVHEFLEREGVTLRIRNACERNRELVLKMNADGASLTAIGRAVGTNKNRVRQFLRKNGETRKFPVSWRGERSNQWKGGRNVDKDGYIILLRSGHPMARKNGYVLEHRLVMAQHLGRMLLDEEVVHHRNKNKQDNRIDNLELFEENSKHLKHELTGKCPKWTDSGRRRIQEGVRRMHARRAEIRQKQKEQGVQPSKRISPRKKASPRKVRLRP
jgi:hypothetical protein